MGETLSLPLSLRRNKTVRPEPVCIFFSFCFWFSVSPFAKESAKQNKKEKNKRGCLWCDPPRRFFFLRLVCFVLSERGDCVGLPDKRKKKKEETCTKKGKKELPGEKKKTRRTKGCEKLYPKTKLFKEKKKVSAAALFAPSLVEMLLS
jgi:hypothetical protein